MNPPRDRVARIGSDPLERTLPLNSLRSSTDRAEPEAETAAQAARVRRRPGRPRRSAGDPERRVREEILVTASRLFAEHGFAGTPIQQIADALNLRAPTIYHYFRHKEDILREIARYTIETSLIYAGRLPTRSASATLNLYQMLHEHVERLCASPYNLKALVDVRPYEFEGLELWREQVRLWGEKLRAQVRRGIRQGEFRRVDVDRTYSVIIGLIASVLYERASKERSQPRKTAEFIATFATRALMVDPSRLEAILAQAPD